MAVPADDFVRLVMDRLGAASPSQLAERMSWKRGTERLVAKWLNGDAKPGYAYTMEMLEAAGWIVEQVEPLDDEERAEIARQLEAAESALQRLREELGR